ncbi:MAG: HipA domain-containing protein [Sediminibacterium sp.]|nr:HipA domain-containing protein [Sediminibacterium sp.]MDP1811703.1 HipA domain-containing protein [Sediminibacterium sp.]MDP3127462.1 HipA domain-containing protein [Sediminibacterium sp.]
MAEKRNIQVYAHWQGLENPALMGVLSSERLKGKEIFSFSYTKEWFDSGFAQYIDPALQLYTGPQYLDDTKDNFGVFLDSSPDRWGRLLMRRREAAIARAEKRKENTLFETDYLLGVFDGHRMGGIRFKTDPGGAFLNDNAAMASPPWTSLKELEYASLQLEKDDAVNDPDYLKWLNLLVAPGSSLGGARPKASVLDGKRHLWIAKFPSNNDGKDIGGWEMVVNELAIKAGLNVAEGTARQFSKKQHTFLTKRFDRTNTGERIHFASAMTLLGLNDGNDHTEGISYLHIAEFLMRSGANVTADLEELWRRIVFNICVSNTDDHLRNHGFLLSNSGWLLSPAFDINPVENSTGLKLNITLTDNALDLEIALEVAGEFRVKKERANEIIKLVKASVSKWRLVAEKNKLPKAEQELLANAFITEK